MARGIIFVALLVACGGDREPVARLAISPSTITLAPGRCATVTLKWEMLRPLDRLRGQPYVFVHLIERAHKVKRTFDHPLPSIASSTVEYPIDVCQSLLAPPLEPRRYMLSAGLFDSEWGYRWPLTSAGTDLGEREYALATVVVPAPGDNGEIEFRGGWGPPVDTYPDKQVVVRRNIARRASLYIARRASDNLRMVIRSDGRSVVANGCDGMTHELPGGHHVVSLPACDGGEIQLSGNMAIESIAWLSGSSRTRS